MPIEFERLEKPLRKLRKTLKRWPSNPTVEEVHKLRTQTRRLEAILSAFMLEQQLEMRRLLKTMAPIRKAAGAVRDMDVLVADTLTLPDAAENESIVHLVEYLGSRRADSASELRHAIADRRKQARRHLKQCIRLIGSEFSRKKLQSLQAAPARAVGVATGLASELREWPRLNEDNLHDFRKQVKKVRYILQLGVSQGTATETPWLEALGKVKDEIGDWHDWRELLHIAQDVLDKEHDGATLKQIAETASIRFKRALASTNSLRARYLSSREGRQMSDSVVKTAARLSG